MKIDLPVFRFESDPVLSRVLKDAAARVIDSKWYVLGQEVQAFEREFAAACGSAHCVGVANGTDALELALRAVGVSPGDRVLTVANAGYYASAAIRAIGASPFFVDVGDRLVMTAATVERALPRARAIVVTHLYGRMAPVDEIAALARPASVEVVEDCAQAHGAVLAGRNAGTTGVAGCFSFYPTKNLGALGDAGAVVTSDADVAARVRSLRQYGWDAKYAVARGGGRNSRLDEMQAAFLRAKLAHLPRWITQRVAIATRYREGLRGLPVHVPAWDGSEYVAHFFVIRCAGREALRAHLASVGIGTDVHYPIPDYAQSVEDAGGGRGLPVTSAACREVLTLPCFPGMTDAEVDRVIGAVHDYYDAYAS